ncbi:VOC family protein [Pseudonocardia alni subsp. carboxydivorans]|uniref:VOC family protein n=1 Tax=Pseudonocardia alni subsp. carboxydivorans TaxID=415010 RepID=A0ABU9AK78_PSEA5
MPVQMNPYLHFENRAREAMEFYRSVLGGELQVMTFGDRGAEGPVPPPDGVMHAYLGTPDGFALMASDGDPQRPVGPPSGISVSLSGDDPDKLRGFFAGLAEGGVVDVPMEKQMWGDEFGQLTDRFGVRWLVNASAPTT